MTNFLGGRRVSPAESKSKLRSLGLAVFLSATTALTAAPNVASAQSYRFNSVSIEGNQRIEDGTILSYAGIARGQTVSAGELNAAYQRILASGLFESVEIVPRGGTLVIEVTEYPTVNRVAIEGNRRLKDEDLTAFLEIKPRLVFDPAKADRDAEKIAEAYAQQGRLASRVTPKIIRRSDNRVDVVFEVFEGDVTEIERISFVGNAVYPDRRLRRVLSTKQAGLLRRFLRSDTLVEDRIEFDKQVLSDFYMSRGYVDFRVMGVNAELARERDAYFVTFNVHEGDQFRVGEITTISDLSDVDADEFQEELKLKSGDIYTPTGVENAISRLEGLANKKGLNFVRVEPRISRNERDLTLDVEFELVRGPRVFVERIDIEGNTTTLDQVIRRQFRIVEGDPFNPREIRETAERIRALGFFGNSDVRAREGSRPDQVIVDVSVEEQPTGSLNFGGTYSTNAGLGLVIGLRERNFLGRGQSVALNLSGAEGSRVYSLQFTEPALLGRDLSFSLDATYSESTSGSFANFDTETIRLRPGLSFALGEKSRLGVFTKAERISLKRRASVTDLGGIVTSEIDRPDEWDLGLGYRLTYDSRIDELERDRGYRLTFEQEAGGMGSNNTYIKTTGNATAQTKVFNDEITLRATVEAGILAFNQGSSRSVDRFQIGSGLIRGFQPDGIGPREIVRAGGVPTGAIVSNDALGGDKFAVARFEAEFPLGLPEEYGLSGGVFYDVGSVWGVGNAAAATGDVFYDDFTLRQVVGVSLFWTTPIGPLRFNWSHALQKEEFDQEQTFNLTVSTQF
ncbi:outer membrane protein assembly factor BamA [Thalassovita mediterranea]|jgi:outer membrane protein insertion porin family|uniref:Outer membrane protein assembly factor BamA n=1 Tax=Thalassovita mediterranea TaxID=340021 RepID=A0A0P1HD71_9RHOB|nr:outer membrane protein assembly factor BamA [Thalassovita mediterranea]CUH84952.1 Outer membrane protein Omp85 [Thalassovita mediterranea]SIS28949.1 Beta-barrel assembly machine subunit BamA [Thalassovita mediterranea]